MSPERELRRPLDGAAGADELPPDPEGARRRRQRRRLGGLLAAAAAGGLGLVALGSDGGTVRTDPPPASDPPPGTTMAPPATTGVPDPTQPPPATNPIPTARYRPLTVLDPVDLSLGANERAVDLSAGGGTLWIAVDSGDGRGALVGLDPVSATARTRVDLPASPSAVLVAHGAVWATGPSPGSVWRVDPATDRATLVDGSVLTSPPAGSLLAPTADAVWVIGAGGSLLRIDPAAARVTAALAIEGATPVAVSASGEAAIRDGRAIPVLRIVVDVEGALRVVTLDHAVPRFATELAGARDRIPDEEYQYWPDPFATAPAEVAARARGALVDGVTWQVAGGQVWAVDRWAPGWSRPVATVGGTVDRVVVEGGVVWLLTEEGVSRFSRPPLPRACPRLGPADRLEDHGTVDVIGGGTPWQLAVVGGSTVDRAVVLDPDGCAFFSDPTTSLSVHARSAAVAGSMSLECRSLEGRVELHHFAELTVDEDDRVLSRHELHDRTDPPEAVRYRRELTVWAVWDRTPILARAATAGIGPDPGFPTHNGVRC